MDTADFDRLAETPRRRLPVSEIHTDRPSPARIYDYWLGGKNNYPVDREVAETIMALAPTTRTSIRENRDFLLRAVRHLAEQGKSTSFLDIGCGLPFAPNVHEVAQSVIPDARVAYVDSDPIVLRHAHALMERSDPQHIAVIHADLRQPRRSFATRTRCASWISKSPSASCSSRCCTSSRPPKNPNDS